MMAGVMMTLMIVACAPLAVVAIMLMLMASALHDFVANTYRGLESIERKLVDLKFAAEG